MSKKIAGIILVIASAILFIVYIANWVTDNNFSQADEATIYIQNQNISNKEIYIDQCKAAKERVYDFERVYGSNYTTKSLIDEYDDLISEARTDITVARAKISSAKKNIERVKMTGYLIVFASISFVVVGIILLVKATKKSVSVVGSTGDSEYTWVCPACGASNSNFKNICDCGLRKDGV